MNGGFMWPLIALGVALGLSLDGCADKKPKKICKKWSWTELPDGKQMFKCDKYETVGSSKHSNPTRYKDNWSSGYKWYNPK